MNMDRRHVGIFSIVREIMIAGFLAVTGYFLLQVVEIQKDIVALRKDVATAIAALKTHDSEQKEDAFMMGKIHHGDDVPRCTSNCHK